jgi:hypothetical protein
MCQNSCPFPIVYVGPKYILRYQVVCSVPKLVKFLERGISIPSPNTKGGLPQCCRHLWLLIQYTGIYPPYVEVLSSICNLRTLHAMVTGTHISWTDEYQNSKLFLVWSCCCCETLMKLNNILTLGYALFVLHAPHSVGTYRVANLNNSVSHPGRPESPATLLSEPHSLYRLSYVQNT